MGVWDGNGKSHHADYSLQPRRKGDRDVRSDLVLDCLADWLCPRAARHLPLGTSRSFRPREPVARRSRLALSDSQSCLVGGRDRACHGDALPLRDDSVLRDPCRARASSLIISPAAMSARVLHAAEEIERSEAVGQVVNIFRPWGQTPWAILHSAGSVPNHAARKKQ